VWFSVVQKLETIPEKISKNYRVVYGPEGKRIFARVCPDNVAPV